MPVMDMAHGIPVFLHEIEEDTNGWIEKEIRVIGMLKYTQIRTATAIIEQYLNHSKHRIIVDTLLVGNITRCNNDVIEILGKLTWDDTSGSSRYSQLPPEFQVKLSEERVPVIRAHIIRDAQGLNMALYQEVVKLRRQFESDFNELLENEGLEDILIT
ncbi:39481_t:CDS:2 [Gigaspora margarita]|uniref:39481_t:CDS:1 n=1 Tax=Gigaspora margarita TaxID=4874 RepID=A0ABN7VBK1_GIGMA|nr:39481_t:CDS:2 [Gigaspora margarita]